jgi:uncharacterized BrkB/YihY/UPF0761 family membrane protein
VKIKNEKSLFKVVPVFFRVVFMFFGFLLLVVSPLHETYWILGWGGVPITPLTLISLLIRVFRVVVHVLRNRI